MKSKVKKSKIQAEKIINKLIQKASQEAEILDTNFKPVYSKDNKRESWLGNIEEPLRSRIDTWHTREMFSAALGMRIMTLQTMLKYKILSPNVYRELMKASDKHSHIGRGNKRYISEEFIKTYANAKQYLVENNIPPYTKKTRELQKTEKGKNERKIRNDELQHFCWDEYSMEGLPPERRPKIRKSFIRKFETASLNEKRHLKNHPEDREHFKE
jgi:hypothetical protein